MRLFYLAALVFAPALAAVAADPATPPHRFMYSRAAQQDEDGFYYQPAGLCEDYPEETTTLEKIREDLQIARDAGAKVLRVGIGWDGIEEKEGDFQWLFWDEFVRLAPEYGITLIPYLCYTPGWAAAKQENEYRQPPRDPRLFARFAGKIAARYGKKIGSWELWNEPDNRDYWLGGAAEFAEMLAESAAAVRKAAPHATLVLGGLTGGDREFSDALVKHGTVALVDVVNVHGYHETWNNDRIEQFPSFLESFAATLARSTEPARDVWLAEFGYSDFREDHARPSEWVRAVHQHEHTTEFQAVMLLRAHALALAAGNLSLTAWFRIRDLPATQDVIGDQNNRFFGIVDVAGNPKPAFHALRLFNALFDGPVRPVPHETSAQDDTGSVVELFEKKSGGFVMLAWLRSTVPDEASDGRARDQRHETIEVSFPDFTGRKLTVFDVKGEKVNTAARLEETTLKNIELRGDGIFIAELR